MKHVLVSYHPYDGSFNAAMVSRIIDAIEQKEGHSVEHIDLSKTEFNPVMSAQELYEFAQARTERGVILENLDPVAVEFANKINSSDHLILVFPIWWELMPAKMKGFIDKVVFPTLFYRYKSEFTMQTVSETLKKVSVVTTMNTPHILYALVFKSCVYHALVRGTFKKLGIKNTRWLNYGFIKKQGEEKRKKLLEKLPSKLAL